MLQLLIGGSVANELLPSNATEYNVLDGGGHWYAAESNVWQVMPAAGTLTSLLVESSGAPNPGESYTFTVRVNGASPGGGLVATITDPATQAMDRVNSINVNAGDYVDIQCVGSAGAHAVRQGRWSCVFTGSTPGQSVVLGSTPQALNAGAARLAQLAGGYCFWNPIGNLNYQVIPTNGTLRNLYVRLSAAPGVNPDGYRFRLYINGAIPGGTPDVTITAPATTGSDLVNSVAVNAGDVISLQSDPLNGPAATPTAHWGIRFDPTIDGECIYLGGTDNALNNAAIEYMIFHGERSGWGNAENSPQGGQVPPGGTDCILRKFYVWLAAAPGAGTTWRFDIRRNGADTGITVSISDLATTGNDLVNTQILADYDDLQIQSEATVGAPANTHAHWGIVGYIAPAAAAGPVGRSVAAALIANRLI